MMKKYNDCDIANMVVTLTNFGSINIYIEIYFARVTYTF